MLEIKIEEFLPVEFDGLTIVEGATWAKLQVNVCGLSLTSRSPNESFVYGSVFHLARFLAENYWLLLWEGKSELEGWMEDHNIFLSREGMPYPNLTISSFDGENVLLEWEPTNWCIHSGSVVVPRYIVEWAMIEVIERVNTHLLLSTTEETDEEEDFLHLVRDLQRSVKNRDPKFTELAKQGANPLYES